MVQRAKRLEQFSDAQRLAFLKDLQAFHSTTCATMRHLRPGSDDYKLVSALAATVYAAIGEMSGNNALWTQR